jgi:hypothetical protein
MAFFFKILCCASGLLELGSDPILVIPDSFGPGSLDVYPVSCFMDMYEACLACAERWLLLFR